MCGSKSLIYVILSVCGYLWVLPVFYALSDFRKETAFLFTSVLFCGAHSIPRGSCGNLICGMQNARVQVGLLAEHLQSSRHPSQSHAFLPGWLSCQMARAVLPLELKVGGAYL